jgi:hypothetical protein
MDQWTAAQCWLYEKQLAYRQRVISALLLIANKYGAKIDWENTDLEEQLIAFDVDPSDEHAFAIDLAKLLEGEEA